MTQFGFKARGASPGQGDCNGVIQSYVGDGSNISSGEITGFWEDLSTAHLVEGNFSTASWTASPASPVTVTGLPLYMPPSKLGGNDYVYITSGGVGDGNHVNYFGLSGVTQLSGAVTVADLTAMQAYNIDRKMDDGQPQTGAVLAFYKQMPNGGAVAWAGATDTSATPGSSTTCYDNGNVGGAAQKYSLTQNNGAGVNCALSFAFQ